MILTGILAYCIPDIPRSVREYLNYEHNQAKEHKLRSLHETYQERRKKSKELSFREQTLNFTQE